MSELKPGGKDDLRHGWRRGPGQPLHPPPTLRQRYQWYRERQLSMLLSVLPRDAVRSLYGQAREWAAQRGEHESKDPMASLRRYCSEILPLPPFQVWAADFRRNRGAYLDDDLEPPGGNTRGEPVTIEDRSVPYRNSTWDVELRVFDDGDVWRGYMLFRDGAGTRFSTADIFCEDSARTIRERFLAFEPDTLRAFLRSSLPS